jgi:hypothetical protein
MFFVELRLTNAFILLLDGRRRQEMTQISLRLDDTVKTEAEELFSRLGMSLSTAINIFLRRAIARLQSVTY